eukprot:4966671-Pyramimonas_sp.AAC.2
MSCLPRKKEGRAACVFGLCRCSRRRGCGSGSSKCGRRAATTPSSGCAVSPVPARTSAATTRSDAADYDAADHDAADYDAAY